MNKRKNKKYFFWRKKEGAGFELTSKHTKLYPFSIVVSSMLIIPQ
jgi:hypothetical protein